LKWCCAEHNRLREEFCLHQMVTQVYVSSNEKLYEFRNEHKKNYMGGRQLNG
jgi:hypothetical protein